LAKGERRRAGVPQQDAQETAVPEPVDIAIHERIGTSKNEYPFIVILYSKKLDKRQTHRFADSGQARDFVDGVKSAAELLGLAVYH
jgi:hypothetical protein